MTSEPPLVLQFAEHAGRAGWTEKALRDFCALHGISSAEKAARWPRGVRSLGRELNALADEMTRRTFAGASNASLREIVLSRFAQNQSLRAAVASLARSDLWHPLDTLARTRDTARVMWQCCRSGRPHARLSRVLRRELLVLAYSVCVIVWLFDRSADQGIAKRLVGPVLAIAGLR